MFRLSTLWSFRRRALALAILDDGHEGVSRRRIQRVAPSASNIKAGRFGSRVLPAPSGLAGALANLWLRKAVIENGSRLPEPSPPQAGSWCSRLERRPYVRLIVLGNEPRHANGLGPRTSDTETAFGV